MRSTLKAVRLAAALFLALAASAVSASETQARLPKEARVVSIGGSVTEIVYALGAQERLIARDSTSVYPHNALSLPDVGYMRQLSPEGVLSVNPGAIIALQGSGPPEAVDVLKKASVPYRHRAGTLRPRGHPGEDSHRRAALAPTTKAGELAKAVEADLKSAEADAQCQS